MKCVNCGAELSEDARFCSECGQAVQVESRPLPPIQPLLPQYQPALPPASSAQAAKPQRRPKPLAIIAGIVIAGGLALGGQQFYLKYRDEQFLASARNGDVIAVKAFLARGVNPNVTTDTGGMTALMQAAMFGETATVKALIAAGADVNAHMDTGLTALHYAAFDGRATTVQALIDARADVNAKGTRGTKPLHFARAQGHMEIVRILQEAGATE